MSRSTATILSVLVMGLSLSKNDEFHDDDRAFRELAGAGLAVSIAGLAPHIAFYMFIWPRPSRPTTESTEVLQQRPSPSRPIKRRSIAVHLSSISPGSPKFLRSYSEPTSPSFSAFSTSPRSSLRDSVSQALRPMTSKTRLLLGTSIASRDSRSLHSGEPATEARRNNDDFENWDTSAVEQGYETPFGSKSKIMRLETIPGSRPVSPAHPLEGPFANYIVAENTPCPDSPTLSPRCVSPASETHCPPSFPRSTTRTTEANDQSHIHPLFRSESPVPPPLASPGTVITASPYAGQIISPDMARGPMLGTSPIGSRPSTPRLGLSPAKSAGSLRSLRANPSSPTTLADLPDRSASQLSLSHSSQTND